MEKGRRKSVFLIIAFAGIFLLLSSRRMFAADARLAEKANAFAAYIESHDDNEYFGPSEIFPEGWEENYVFMNYKFADYDSDGEYELYIGGKGASANYLISILDEEEGSVCCRFHGWGTVEGRYSASGSESSLLIINEGNSSGENIFHFRLDGFDEGWEIHVLGESVQGIDGIDDFSTDSQHNPISSGEYFARSEEICNNCAQIEVISEGGLDNCNSAQLAALLRSMGSVPASGYILPESDTRNITDEDIAGFSRQKLNYAKNEIYARHGRKFKSRELMDYFSSQSWYSGTIEPEDFQDSKLSSLELTNALYLRDKEFSDGVGYTLDQDGYDISKVIETLTPSAQMISGTPETSGPPVTSETLAAATTPATPETSAAQTTPATPGTPAAQTAPATSETLAAATTPATPDTPAAQTTPATPETPGVQMIAGTPET